MELKFGDIKRLAATQKQNAKKQNKMKYAHVQRTRCSAVTP